MLACLHKKVRGSLIVSYQIDIKTIPVGIYSRIFKDHILTATC